MTWTSIKVIFCRLSVLVLKSDIRVVYTKFTAWALVGKKEVSCYKRFVQQCPIISKELSYKTQNCTKWFVCFERSHYSFPSDIFYWYFENVWKNPNGPFLVWKTCPKCQKSKRPVKMKWKVQIIFLIFMSILPQETIERISGHCKGLGQFWLYQAGHQSLTKLDKCRQNWVETWPYCCLYASFRPCFHSACMYLPHMLVTCK